METVPRGVDNFEIDILRFCFFSPLIGCIVSLKSSIVLYFFVYYFFSFVLSV